MDEMTLKEKLQQKTAEIQAFKDKVSSLESEIRIASKVRYDLEVAIMAEEEMNLPGKHAGAYLPIHDPLINPGRYHIHDIERARRAL